jgi:hypothetical protein
MNNSNLSLSEELMFRIRVVLDGHVNELKHGMPVTMLYQE